MAREQPSAAALFHALNRSLSPVFDHRYASGSGTLHTVVCAPASRQMMVGFGGDAAPDTVDFAAWSRGANIPLTTLAGQLRGTAKPFDPSRRRVASPPGHGSAANVFIGTSLGDALFKDLSLAKARFANVSLAGAHFDDIDFSNAVITANCNFRGMRIGGIAVADLLAAYREGKDPLPETEQS